MDANLIMQPDGGITAIVPASGKHYTLKEIQGHLDGGYVEMVAIPGDSQRVALVDEAGLLKGLDINPGATLLLRRTIVGKCVVVPRSTFR